MTPHYHIMIALSTYTSTPFGLFTSVAHKGIFRLFTSIVFQVGYLHDFGFGRGRVPHQLGSSLFPSGGTCFPTHTTTYLVHILFDLRQGVGFNKRGDLLTNHIYH